MSDWGKGVNNNIGWGQGANNDIGWGSIYDKSNAGETLLSGSGFDPAYQAVLNYANSEEDTLPASNIQTAQNKWFEAINPFFSKFKELHLWAGEAGLGGFKSIDFARLSKADYYNSPSLLANGIKGNGTSSYVDLNFNCLTETQEDSITIGYYSIDGTNGDNSGVIGSYDLSTQIGSYIFPSTVEDNRIVAGANSGAKKFDNLGLGLGGDNELISVSQNGIQLKLRRNEISLGVLNITPGRTSLSSYALARNRGFASFHTATTLALTFHADELTASELGILATATKNYLSEI